MRSGREGEADPSDKRAEQNFHKANKNRAGDWVVNHLLILPAARRAFGGVYVYVHPAALSLRGKAAVPAIFCATHAGWWDGYLAGIINRNVFKHDGYLMMEEDSLKRYPFFTWTGVFGVDRDHPRKALASIHYSAQLLAGHTGSALWIFPQGTITHPDARPLRLYGGVAAIARRVGRCALVPVALRYEFRMEQAPDAFAHAGPPLVIDAQAERLSSKDITSRLEAAMVGASDALRDDLVSNNLRAYRRILSGRGSSNRIWDGLLRVLGTGRSGS
ncbi:MAG: lysophospholipid acyltransferase family protein [Chloroflexia bacterium]